MSQVFVRRMSSVLQARCAKIACASGIAGLLSMVPLGTPIRSLLLGALILLGAGSAVAAWFELPVAAVIAFVPTASLSVAIGATAVMSWTRSWHPSVLTVALSAFVLLLGFARLRSGSEYNGEVVRVGIE